MTFGIIFSEKHVAEVYLNKKVLDSRVRMRNER
jgi:hypothetical protein